MGLSTSCDAGVTKLYLCRMRKISGLIIGLFLFTGVKAQNSTSTSYSLEDCIKIALTNNIDIQLAKISESQTQIDYNQSRLNLTPDLSASAGQYYQSGRSIDRFTNQFVQTTVGNSSFQLQSNLVVYQGGQLRNAIKQTKLLNQASVEDVLQAKQTIALNVALAYLQCLQSMEQVKASNANVTAQENELKRIQALVDAGSANTGMLLAAKSQMANAKSSLVQTNSAYKTNLLNLKNLLLLPYSQVFEIKTSAAIVPTSGTFPIPINELIDSAIKRRPEYKSQNLRKKSSELSVKIAKGALYPSVFLGGSLNSVYSGNSKAISNVSLAGSQPIGYVSNTNEIVEAPVFNYTLTTIDFGKQVKDNFGQSFGASVNMPIYGKLQARSNISKAELGVLQNELSLKRLEQTITNEVNSAYQAFQNAFAQYSALNENHTAQKQNLEFLRLKFENGQANYFELQLAQTNEIAAYQNMLAAKYELALRNMILEFLYTNQQQLLNNF